MAGVGETLQAENSEQFQIMQQHVETVRSYLDKVKNYLPYLQSENADHESIAQINAHLMSIESMLEDVLNDTRKSEIDKLHTAAKKDLDYHQYLTAYKMYEDGNVRRALAKFKLLAQTTYNQNIKASAEESIQLIEGHDWGENGLA
jgi:hypothetical protein